MAAKKKNQDALRFQQVEAGKQALGTYQPLLQWAMQNAGLQLPQQPKTAQPMTPTPAVQQPGRGFGTANRGQQAAMPMPAAPSPQPGASIQPVGQPQPLQQPQVGLPNSALGVYGQGADALRFQQAEEDVNDAARQRANLLRYRLGQQGIGSSGTMASALAQNERAATDSLADFRRNLAINAGGEQERRMQLLAQMLGLGHGIGSQGQEVSGMYKKLDAQKPGLLGQLTQLAPLFL